MRHGWQDDGEIKVESQYHDRGREAEPLEHNLIILMEISMGRGGLLKSHLSNITDLGLFLNTRRNSLVKASTTTDRVQQFNCPSDHEKEQAPPTLHINDTRQIHLTGRPLCAGGKTPKPGNLVRVQPWTNIKDLCRQAQSERTFQVDDRKPL